MSEAIFPSFKFTSFEKMQGLKSLVAECSKPPSAGFWHKGAICPLISKLDREHQINAYQLQSGLQGAERVWKLTLESHRKAKLSGPQKQTRLFEACQTERFVEEKLYQPREALQRNGILLLNDSPFRDSKIRIIANRAAISKLTIVLQQEIAWMEDARCSALSAIDLLSEKAQLDGTREQLEELVVHFNRIIDESNRLIKVEVTD
jgi:hypothetical protein